MGAGTFDQVGAGTHGQVGADTFDQAGAGTHGQVVALLWCVVSSLIVDQGRGSEG